MGLLRRHNWRRQTIAPFVHAALPLTALFLAALLLTSSDAGTLAIAAPDPFVQPPQEYDALPVTAPDRVRVAEALRSSPVMFIENVGQFPAPAGGTGDERARFQVHGGDHSPGTTISAPLALNGLTESPWPMWLHDPQHTGRSPYIGPQRSNVKWAFDLAATSAEGSAIGQDGTIYLATTHGLFAIDPGGGLLWLYEPPHTPWGRNTPAIGPDSVIYVVRSGGLSAINPDGSPQWDVTVAVDYTDVQLVLGQKGTLYYAAGCILPSDEQVHPCLIALGPSGDVLWVYDLENGVTYQQPDFPLAPQGSLGLSSPGLTTSPTVDHNGNVYIGYGQTLFAINADGTEKWRKTFLDVDRADGIGTPSIGSGGIIYVVVHCVRYITGVGCEGSLYAIDSDGGVKWEQRVPGYGITSPPLIGSDGSLYVRYIRYGFWSAHYYLAAFDAQGNGKWTLFEEGVPWVVDAEGAIYSVLQSRVRALDLDGNEKWTWHTSSGGWVSSLSLGRDGTLYVIAWASYNTAPALYAIWAPHTPGPPADPDNSTITVQPTSLPADGTTAATITVQLLSANGEPSWGKTVRLESSRGALDTIVQPTTVTDSEGRTTGSIRSTTAGTTTITAFVLDDGVFLSNPVNVTFEPYTPSSGAFLFRLNEVVDTAVKGLTQIKEDAQAIVEYGTYFRGAIGEKKAERNINLVFNLADLIGGINQTRQLLNATRVTWSGCYVVCNWSVQFFPDYPAAAYLFDVYIVRIEETSQIAEFLGWNGPKFFGMVREAGKRYITKEVAKKATRVFFIHLNDGMSTFVYPAIRDTADDLTALLEVQRDNLLANLPAMTPEHQSAYEKDLAARSKALNMLRGQLYDKRMALGDLRMSREGLNRVLFALRLGANLLASYANGPGIVLKSLVMAPFDWYMDSHQLSEDEYAYDLATGTLLGTPGVLFQTYSNASSALERIARGLPPNPATGRINSITQHNQGGDWGPFWNETASWSEVSLTNTSNSETTYLVRASYLANIERFRLTWTTINLVEEASITLVPDASGTVRVDYKRATTNGIKGLSPEQGSNIVFDVLGTNEAGTYYITTTSSEWQPSGPALTGMRALAAAEDLPIIDPPLTTYVLSAPWTQKHEAQLWINNPFTSTVPVSITQTLPPDITLLDPGGATQSDNTLTWHTVVSPTALGVVTFTFGFSATPGTESSLPAATLNLVNPLDGQSLTAESNVASFQALWPLTLDYATPGYVLPGSNPSVAITVTNWLSDSEITGTLAISVTDALSATMYTESQPFRVAAGATGAITFTLPATLVPGNYVVHGRVNANGATAEAFADPLQVGLPGPLLDYRVSPLGVVHPSDTLTYTLRFTNTTGVPLSDAVLTASLPVSVTVVAGSVTGSGVVESGQVWWTLGTVAVDQPVELSFAVQVNADAAPPGVEPGRLLSEPRLIAEEIALTWGPVAWNLVSLCGLVQGDVDCNCTVDATDLQILANSWRATRADPAYVPLYDVVPDESINIVDIQDAAANWLASCP